MADPRLPGMRTVVIAPGPTANGDLHLGHLAGPFLAADVCVRFARASGQEVLFGTGIHSTQNYIVTTARRLGVDPETLRATSADQVEESLAVIGIEADAFVRFDEDYVKTVVGFFDRLHASGALRLRTVPLPWSRTTGEFLTDAYVRGGCPVCLADGCAGLCEGCGHWVAPGALIDPRSTLQPDDVVELRDAELLVLPVEEHRAGLEEHFARLAPTMRPRLARMIAEMLARPLPDYPITLPIAWGIPAPFPETPGQVLYSDAETIAWSMHATALAARRRGAVLAADDEPWYSDAGSRVVYFFGSDASYAFAVVGTALLLALGGYVLPEQFVTNEFYELDNDKFSTSRGHLVSGRELSAEVPRDVVRYYLAATAPEFQRSNFTRAAMARVTDQRLVAPWNRVAAAVTALTGPDPLQLPVTAAGRAAARLMVDRFGGAYDVRWFSLTAAAFTLTEQLARLDTLAAELTSAVEPAVEPDRAGDFCYQVEVFLRCAAPLLVDLAARALPDSTIPRTPDGTTVTARPLPGFTGTGG